MDTATAEVWVSVAHVPGSAEGAITPHGDVMPAETEDVLPNILVSRPHSGQDVATATERGGGADRQRAGTPIKTHPPDKPAPPSPPGLHANDLRASRKIKTVLSTMHVRAPGPPTPAERLKENAEKAAAADCRRRRDVAATD